MNTAPIALLPRYTESSRNIHRYANLIHIYASNFNDCSHSNLGSLGLKEHARITITNIEFDLARMKRAYENLPDSL